MVHFEDKGMFPKMHWRILEDSGRFLARMPLEGVRVLIKVFQKCGFEKIYIWFFKKKKKKKN